MEMKVGRQDRERIGVGVHSLRTRTTTEVQNVKIGLIPFSPFDPDMEGTGMSKYLMNKLIHLVNMNESAEDEYTANPRAFVEKWEKTQKLKLEPEEREALAMKDYGKLYALGAHPFTLWSFTEAVWVHEIPREELVKDYKEKAAQAGYPNFKT